MPVILTPQLEEWIAARVAEGEFDSIEDGVRQLLEERVADRETEADDFAWAKPLVDEGLADIENGDIVTADKFARRTTEMIAAKTRK